MRRPARRNVHHVQSHLRSCLLGVVGAPAALVWDRALAVHGPQLSHAMVDVDSGSWLAAEELPAAAKTAASRLRQLAADAQRGASWFQRARTNALLAEAGLASSSLVPRRLRATKA